MKKSIIIFLTFFCIYFFVFASFAETYCSPGNPAGFVNDFAGMMNDEEKQLLENKLSQFKKESSNEISVVTVNNLGEDTIENFAVKLFEEWKIGKEKNDNGVLILVSKEDRRMRIEVGYGLESSLTDAISSQIINNVMKPSFQNNEYFLGISGAVDRIISVTKGRYAPSKNVLISLFNKRYFNFPVWYWFLLIIPMWFIVKAVQSKSLFAWMVVIIFIGLFLRLFLDPKSIDFWYWFSPSIIYIFYWLAKVMSRSKSLWIGGILGGIFGIILFLVLTVHAYSPMNLIEIALGMIGMFFCFSLGLMIDYYYSRCVKRGEINKFIPYWTGHKELTKNQNNNSGKVRGFDGGSSGGGGASGDW